jgi:enamine deaminase RidA (YjgF/YER057c/UK114 family)
VPTNANGEIVGKGDLKVQVKQVYENLKLCLAAAGATFENVVKMNTYVVNYKPEYVTTIREVRSGYLSSKNPPASTLAGVQALYHPDVMIEIEAIAIIN